jgi:hypothetical protein
MVATHSLRANADTSNVPTKFTRLKITDTARDIQTPTKFVFLNINKALPNQINSPLTTAL